MLPRDPGSVNKNLEWLSVIRNQGRWAKDDMNAGRVKWSTTELNFSPENRRRQPPHFVPGRPSGDAALIV
jgi:hypothetical protein